MTALRVLLGVVGVVAFVYAWPALFLIGTFDFGVAIAISAGCVLALELVRVIQTDRDTDRETMRRGREQVWARRDTACSWPVVQLRTPPMPQKQGENQHEHHLRRPDLCAGTCSTEADTGP